MEEGQRQLRNRRKCAAAMSASDKLEHDVTESSDERHKIDAQRDVAEALRAGAHFMKTLGHRDVHVDGVDLAIEMDVTPYHSNAGGMLLGGLTATLIDLVAGRAAMLGVEHGFRTATNDMTVHYLAPIVGGTARAEATVLRRSARSVVVAVDLRDLRRERVAAVAIVSFTVLEPLRDTHDGSASTARS